MSYVILQDRGMIEKKVKRLLKDINIHCKQKLSEFKFARDSKLVRHKFLNLISQLDIEVGQIIIKKVAVKSHLHDSKSILYNYVVAEYITRTILNEYDRIDRINLHLDLSMSKSSRDHFDEYFKGKVSYISWITKNPNNISNQVFHDYSHHEPCIQIADYFAGALYQLYEHSDSRYYDMIKDKILYTTTWGIF